MSLQLDVENPNSRPDPAPASGSDAAEAPAQTADGGFHFGPQWARGGGVFSPSTPKPAAPDFPTEGGVPPSSWSSGDSAPKYRYSREEILGMHKESPGLPDGVETIEGIIVAANLLPVVAQACDAEARMKLWKMPLPRARSVLAAPPRNAVM